MVHKQTNFLEQPTAGSRHDNVKATSNGSIGQISGVPAGSMSFFFQNDGFGSFIYFQVFSYFPCFHIFQILRNICSYMLMFIVIANDLLQ